jgi:hypothetical protein
VPVGSTLGVCAHRPQQGARSNEITKRNDKCFISRIFSAKIGKNYEKWCIFCLKIVERE